MKKISVFIGALGLAAALAGCATNPIPAGLPGGAPSVQDSLGKLGTFTQADIQNADVIAVANNDSLAHQCFEAGHGISKLVADQQAGGGTNVTVSGAISAFEAGRVVVHSGVGQGQIPNYLIVDCAPLLASVRLDAAGFLAQLAAFGIKP